MRYPGGQLIQKGDLVWWNEGTSVGFIHDLIESRENFSWWGLEYSSPQLMFACWHPYQRGDVNGYLCQAAEHSKDDGVGLLTKHEREELEWATAKARAEVAPELREYRFSVDAHLNTGTGKEEWHIEFVDNSSPDNCMKSVASVIIPFRANTRS